jgi:hypothetical protein
VTFVPERGIMWAYAAASLQKRETYIVPGCRHAFNFRKARRSWGKSLVLSAGREPRVDCSTKRVKRCVFCAYIEVRVQTCSSKNSHKRTRATITEGKTVLTSRELVWDPNDSMEGKFKGVRLCLVIEVRAQVF